MLLDNFSHFFIFVGVTTFLGVCITAAGKSEIFRVFFKMLFGIVILGLLNGLLFLPVLLSGKAGSKMY